MDGSSSSYANKPSLCSTGGLAKTGLVFTFNRYLHSLDGIINIANIASCMHKVVNAVSTRKEIDPNSIIYRANPRTRTTCTPTRNKEAHTRRKGEAPFTVPLGLVLLCGAVELPLPFVALKSPADEGPEELYAGCWGCACAFQKPRMMLAACSAMP